MDKSKQYLLKRAQKWPKWQKPTICNTRFSQNINKNLQKQKLELKEFVGDLPYETWTCNFLAKCQQKVPKSKKLAKMAQNANNTRIKLKTYECRSWNWKSLSEIFPMRHGCHRRAIRLFGISSTKPVSRIKSCK